MAIRFDGYDGPTHTAPTCWRTGVFKQTIAEVANPSSGAIWKIVLASLRPIRSQPIISAIPADKTGMPYVSLSSWGSDQVRVDVEQGVSGSLVDRELTVVFGNVDPACLHRIVCNSTSFLIDHVGSLRGIQVGNLSEHAVANIRRTAGEAA